MAAPEPNPAAAIDAASDRAALLRYVLDHVLERCALPDGVSNAAHLDLDRVDVPALLASLREPGGRPDLRAATGDPAGAPDAVDASTATGTNDDADFPPVVSFESLGIAIPSLAAKTRAAPGAAGAAGATDAAAPTPKRSLSLVLPVPRGASLDATSREALDAQAKTNDAANDLDAVGVAAPVPELILAPLRGGGPFGDPSRDPAETQETHETQSSRVSSSETTREANAAVALCAFEALVASVGDVGAPVVDIARAALEISPAEAAASLELLAPRARDAHEEAVAGGVARVHLRLLAEAGGCGSADAAGVFASAALGGARARAAFARRQLAAVTETLWAARDAAAAAAARGSERENEDETPLVARATEGSEPEDGARSDAPSAGAVVEEVSRLAARALSDEALLTTNDDGDFVALDEATLSSTVEAVVEMVESCLDARATTQSRLGSGANAWRYPPALAGRAYARLLDAAFDPLDEGALADDARETLASLSGPGGVGERLGVDVSARRAMLAWSLARRYRETSVGEGLFASDRGDRGGGDTDANVTREDELSDAETRARRAYARAVRAEAEAERDDEEEDDDGGVPGVDVAERRDPYALLSMATRALCAVKEALEQETERSRLRDDDVALVLTHAALGPVSWWAEGALCDFYKDVDVVAAELARRLPTDPPVVATGGVPVKATGDVPPMSVGPAMTATGFERVLRLGVAAADARARVAAATAPGFDGDAAAVGLAAGRALAARACALSADEAYARLKVTAEAHDVETARARGELSLNRAESGTNESRRASAPTMDAAPGARVLARGCAALADAFEAHLARRVASAAGPAAANSAPASLAERFGADLSAWLAQVPPLDAGALAALAAARDFQNAVAAAVADRAAGAVGGVGDGVDVVRKVDKSFAAKEASVGDASTHASNRPGRAEVTASQNALTRTFEPFRLETRIAPSVFAWVAGRAATMRRATMRAARAETWRGVAAIQGSGASHGAAFSAVELVRSAWDTLEAFWALDVPAPAAAMRALTEGLDGAFQEYAEHVASSLGAPEAFAPSLPTLTRYKKDVVEGARRAFEAERASSRAKGPRAWWGDFDEDAPWGEGPEREREGPAERGSGAAGEDRNVSVSNSNDRDRDRDVFGGFSEGARATLPQLCARVASLHFLTNELAALECEVPARFAKMQRSQGVGETWDDEKDGEAFPKDAYANFDPTNPYAPKRPGVWFDGLLDGARQTLASCSRKVADYVAYKVVYWDLRRLFIEGLYRGGVEHGERAGAVVARLEAALSEIAERLPSGGASSERYPRDETADENAYLTRARDEVVHALLRATAQGLMWVMLDGGVGRVFAEGDAAALEEDLFRFRDLFVAGGEGVPEPTVDAVMRRVDRLVTVMSLDTPTLCDAYLEQEARDREKGDAVGAGGLAASPGGGGSVGQLDAAGGFGASTLLRVLCHREDREASKFLKAHCHLPKGDEGSVMSIVRGKGNSAAAFFAKKVNAARSAPV